VSTGVTTYQPTLISSPAEVVLSAIDAVAKARVLTRPRIIGAHLEGPFIAPEWKGAPDGRYVIAPDLALAVRLCAAGQVTTMTIAPEQPGGFELLDWLVRRRVIVSVGHSGADAATAHQAFNRGAQWVTHLHNAQRRFTARDPGISAVAMTRRDVTIGLIARQRTSSSSTSGCTSQRQCSPVRRCGPSNGRHLSISWPGRRGSRAQPRAVKRRRRLSGRLVSVNWHPNTARRD
jgi:N-acetylglucosamine-6-phosphate deacetylase